MKIDYATTGTRLKKAKDVLILTHRRPDGDTIGSGFGLYYALKKLGIRSRVECSDPFPKKFSYFYHNYKALNFEPCFVVAVDTASAALLGELKPKYSDTLGVDLTIDHHKSNEFFSKETLLDVSSPATAEMMHLVITEMGVSFNKDISNALFTGLVTDTGCFRFSSVTARTHQVAAKLIQSGADHGEINRINFENTSRGRLQVEALARNSMQYYLDDRCAMLYLPNGLEEKYGIEDGDLDGISSLPRMIEGVEIGVTIRDLGEDVYRISVRSRSPYDASRVCSKFGGGGHVNAGGCTLTGKLDEVKTKLLDAIQEEFGQGIK